MIRVYQFGCLAPVTNEALVRAQMRAAHEYRNDLVAVERGRRAALRAVHDTPAVLDQVAVVSKTKKKERRAELIVLRELRKAAEERAEKASGEMTRIAELDASMRVDARECVRLGLGGTLILYWGTYLGIEASADQVRRMPLYDLDGVTPHDPKFVHGTRLGRDAFDATDLRGRAAWWLGDSQIGVQLQKGLATKDALAGTDSRVKLVFEPNRGGRSVSRGAHGYARHGLLSLRVGSEGRAPVWADFPIRLHRAIPDNARWKWVRVSCRRDGMRERWTAEITLDIDACPARDLDTELSGALAVELAWEPLEDGSMRAARWTDDRGAHGETILPARLVSGIRKPDGIRAVRDLVLNDLRPKLAAAIRQAAASGERLPAWLREAGNTLHLWKSTDRFYGLMYRWRRERCDGARKAGELLDAWQKSDQHLYEYETGARREALGERREMYRVLAARWSRVYKTVLLPDRDLSREARWGEESDRRFTASPQEFRGALRHAFGKDAVDIAWRGKHGVLAPEEDQDDAGPDPIEWRDVALERWRDGKTAEGARKKKKTRTLDAEGDSAWSRRKARKLAKQNETVTAREPSTNHVES